MYISKEQYEKLKKELEKLENEERKKVAERLKTALEYGDISENSEYEEALQQKERLEIKILEIKRVLDQAKIINNNNNNNNRGEKKIYPGSTFEIVDKNSKKKLTLTLVGFGEGDFKEGKISTESPLGKAFLGKKINEEVEVETPKGKIVYQIKKIL